MPLLDRQKRRHQIGEIRLGITVTHENGKRVPSKPGRLPVHHPLGCCRQRRGRALRRPDAQDDLAQWQGDLRGRQRTPPSCRSPSSSWRCSDQPVVRDVVRPRPRSSLRRVHRAAVRRELQMPSRPGPPQGPRDGRPRVQADQPAQRDVARCPGLGVWLVQSTGGNAADELGTTAEVLAAARNSGVIIPATLRMEQREQRRDGEKPKKYAVPLLEIGASLRQMTELASGDIASASVFHRG